MTNKLKAVEFMTAGGALGFLVLLAGAGVTGARPWPAQPDPQIVEAAGPTQTLPMTSQLPAQGMSDGMGQGMHPGAMMAQHQETAKLVDELSTRFAAIQIEESPTILKSKLAEYGVLLKQLQTRVQESGRMMNECMKTCPMMKEMMNGTMDEKSGSSDGMKGGMMNGPMKDMKGGEATK